MGDDPQPIALMVDVGGSQMSLADWLKQADSLPGDAEVIVDGKTESVAQYQAWAHEQANGMLDRVSGEINVTIESLSGLAGELSFRSDLVSAIVYDLQQATAGVEGAIGNDQMSNEFKANYGEAFKSLTSLIPVLTNGLSALSEGLNKGADMLFGAEEATLKSFGRTAADPRVPARTGPRVRPTRYR